MAGPVSPIIIPNSDVEALGTPNICFQRDRRKCYRPAFLVGVQTDQKGLERLVLVNANICTIWNQILAFFGWGPLQTVDCRIKTVSQYLEKKWAQLSVLVKDDVTIQCRIESIASRGKIKGARGLWEKAPLILNDFEYLARTVPLEERSACKKTDTASWQLAIADPPLISSNDEGSFYHLHRALKKFPEEEFEETINYFRQLIEISPHSRYLFEKLKKFPRQERAEAIGVFKLLVEKFPHLENIHHSLLDIVFNTQPSKRSRIINPKAFNGDGPFQIPFEELEKRIACIEIIYRTKEAYLSEIEDVSKFIKCFPLDNIEIATYAVRGYDPKSRDMRFKLFCQLVDHFLAFPKEERDEILDRLPAIIKASPWYLKAILFELKKIPPHERASVIDGFIVISDKVVFNQRELDDLSDWFSKLLRIPIDERKDVCTRLCQVLKKSTILHYFNDLLDGICNISKENRDHVINCILSVFMQENVEIYPEIYQMAGLFEITPQEEIKSLADFYLFFKEMLYIPQRIDRVLTEKQFALDLIREFTKDISVSKRDSILILLAPLRGKVRAFPLFNLFLALSKLPEEEGKKFFDSLSVTQWQEILESMPDTIQKEDALLGLFSDKVDILRGRSED